jgi:hypothetical protein
MEDQATGEKTSKAIASRTKAISKGIAYYAIGARGAANKAITSRTKLR